MSRGCSRLWCDTPVLRAGVGLLAAGAIAVGCPASAAGQGQPVPTPASVIDGPSPDLAGATGLGMSIARDGTGGVVYLKQAGGISHVFVARLAGGVFQAPTQIDPALSDPSSQPVIAAGNGGLLLVAFINAGQLMVAEQPAGSSGFGPPAVLAAGGAAAPAISITNLGKAYLAFTMADGGGQDVRAAYFWQDRWALESTPLNVSAADNAGAGAGRPSVAAAGDGVAIVAWGEAGGVYTRRVWGTQASTVSEQADGPLPGCSERSADQPVVGAGGDSSFAAVAFREQLSCAGQTISRVLMNRLRGSAYDGVTVVDGLSGPADGATNPRLAVGEYGDGLITSQTTASRALVATPLSDNELPREPQQVNGSPGAASAPAAPAMAGLYSNLVAWQQDPGGTGSPEIRMRYAANRDPLGPEVVLSSPGQGPTRADAGLAVAGDVLGDAAAAWVQGPAQAPQIMVAQLYQAPGRFSVPKARQFVRTSRPTVSWIPPREPWGPLRFTLAVDGLPVGQTTATALPSPSPLGDGRHTYQVTATNPAGQQSQTGVGVLFVDTTPPVARLALRGKRRVGRAVRARLSYADLPPALAPPAAASGVARVTVRWGDGTATTIRRHGRFATHRYSRARTYTVVLVVTDRAGNSTRVAARLKILKPAQKPKPKPPGKRH